MNLVFALSQNGEVAFGRDLLESAENAGAIVECGHGPCAVDPDSQSLSERQTAAFESGTISSSERK